jgi:hypothetical protein
MSETKLPASIKSFFAAAYPFLQPFQDIQMHLQIINTAVNALKNALKRKIIKPAKAIKNLKKRVDFLNSSLEIFEVFALFCILF